MTLIGPGLSELVRLVINSQSAVLVPDITSAGTPYYLSFLLADCLTFV